MPYENQKFNNIQENIVRLNKVSFEFCSDESITEYYKQKEAELKEKDEWIAENKEEINRQKDQLNEVVKRGLITDASAGAVWEYKTNKLKALAPLVIELKRELQKNLSNIKESCSARLGKFIDKWDANPVQISFQIYPESNACNYGDGRIFIDLERLADPYTDSVEEVTELVTHEIFHDWMQEDKKFNTDTESVSSKKEQVIYRAMDEGLAVLVSGQSLKKHHFEQGRDYEDLIKESFIEFENFLRQNDIHLIEKMEEENFKDMGHFYIAGNEIVKTVLEFVGIDEFKKMMLETKSNPTLFLKKYSEITKTNFNISNVIN